MYLEGLPAGTHVFTLCFVDACSHHLCIDLSARQSLHHPNLTSYPGTSTAGFLLHVTAFPSSEARSTLGPWSPATVHSTYDAHLRRSTIERRTS
jgi:hypothetical protein